MTREPVCGMQVDEQHVAHQSDYEGQTYYFCRSGCKQPFERNPERYTEQ